MCDSTLPPPASLPWRELLASELPLETHSFIMHDWTPWILDAIESCKHTCIEYFFLTNFLAVEVQSNLGGAQWKNYIEQEKSLGWP